MLANTSPPRPFKGPLWIQPVGAWRHRGATTTAVRLGMGLDVSTQSIEADAAPPSGPASAESPKTPADTKGFTLWHYWAEAPDPMVSWKALSESSAQAFRDHLSDRREHPWHRLALRGQGPTLRAWCARFGSVATEATLEGDTLLHCAVWSGNDDAVKTVLKHVKLETVCQQDKQGYTPLMLAIHRCSETTIQKLIKAGCDPNLCDLQGRTALHHAALYSNHSLLSLLEQAGGDMDGPDQMGTTPTSLLYNRREQSDRDRESQREHWRRRHQTKAWF